MSTAPIPIRNRAENQLQQALAAYMEPIYWEIDEVALFEISVAADAPKCCVPVEYLGLPIVAVKGTAGDIRLSTVPRGMPR